MTEKLQSSKKKFVSVQADNTQAGKKKKNLEQLLEAEKGKLMELELVRKKTWIGVFLCCRYDDCGRYTGTLKTLINSFDARSMNHSAAAVLMANRHIDVYICISLTNPCSKSWFG